MKKTFTLILAAVAVSAQAISFQWKSTQVSFGDSLVSDLSPETYTATLVSLGTGTTWGTLTAAEDGTISLGTAKSTGFTADSQSGLTGLAAKKNSTFTGTFDALFGSTTSSGYTVKDNDYFAVVLTYEDSEGTTWYNFASSPYKLSANGDDGAVVNDASFSFASGKTELRAGETASAGGGWYAAVPEPSTAALALAGLALLLKRRKA